MIEYLLAAFVLAWLIWDVYCLWRWGSGEDSRDGDVSQVNE